MGWRWASVYVHLGEHPHCATSTHGTSSARRRCMACLHARHCACSRATVQHARHTAMRKSDNKAAAVSTDLHRAICNLFRHRRPTQAQPFWDHRSHACGKPRAQRVHSTSPAATARGAASAGHGIKQRTSCMLDSRGSKKGFYSVRRVRRWGGGVRAGLEQIDALAHIGISILCEHN